MTSMKSAHIEIGLLFESARLKAELDAEAQSHLKDCDLCRGRLSWMETAAGLGPQELTHEPPQALMDRVLRLGRTGALKRLRKFIVASLSFDSFSNLAPVGVRRAETADRQMTFEAGDMEIALSFRRSEDRNITITGQVLRKSGERLKDVAAHIDLVAEGDHVAKSALSSWGEFVFSNLADGEYGLQISLDDCDLRIPSLKMGSWPYSPVFASKNREPRCLTSAKIGE